MEILGPTFKKTHVLSDGTEVTTYSTSSAAPDAATAEHAENMARITGLFQSEIVTTGHRPDPIVIADEKPEDDNR